MHVTSFGSSTLTSKDQVKIRDSLNVVKPKRPLVDDLGFERMLHSIESCNFLQLEPENYMHLSC